MKKIVLASVALLASASTFAQYNPGTISVKPLVGMTIANQTDADADARIGVAAGAEFEYQATDIFSISAGAMVAQQGCKNLGSNWGDWIPSMPDGLDVKTTYINVPILANVYVAPGLAVKAGVQPEFCVDDDNWNAKSVQMSVPVGLSYQFSNFVIDARYNWGVTKTFESTDSKNSTFLVTLGYKFAL